MSLFRTIFAFENGREVATLRFVFTECLRHDFALTPHPEAKGGRKLAKGTDSLPLTNPTKDRGKGSETIKT